MSRKFDARGLVHVGCTACGEIRARECRTAIRWTDRDGRKRGSVRWLSQVDTFFGKRLALGGSNFEYRITGRERSWHQWKAPS
jgi:hypothetical protein